MTNNIPSEDKKKPLFEIFRAAVWGQLIGNEELKVAREEAQKVGVTDEDIETIVQWDAKQLKDYFGEEAFNRDLINAMKAVDNITSSMGSAFGYGGGAGFKDLGFYK